MIPPIHRVPAEVLAEIFSYCQQEIIIPVTRWRSSYFPFALTHVASRWRDFLLATLSFWHQITVSLQYVYFSHLKAIEAMQTVLARSKNHPLNVTVYPPFESSISDDETGWYAKKFLPRLLAFSDRFNKFTISVDKSSEDYREVITSLNAVQGYFSSLKSLGLSINFDDLSKEEPDCIIDAFNLCSSLTNLSIEDTSEDLQLSVHFPWRQLQSVTVHSRAISVLEILQRCPSLHFLLDMSGKYSGQVVQVTHSSLRHLRVTDMRYLKILTLPFLETLELINPFDLDGLTEAMSSFLAHHANHPPPLKVLKCWNNRLLGDNDHFLYFLSQCPFIEQLTFIYRFDVPLSSLNWWS
jgi:hypothetical protein